MYKDAADFWVQTGCKMHPVCTQFHRFLFAKSSRKYFGMYGGDDGARTGDLCRDSAADTIGYLLGYAHLTNTRSLALLGDPDILAYEILFSFSSPTEKKRFLDLIRSNNELGNEYVVNDLIEPVKEEIRNARPFAAVLPKAALTRAMLVATTIASSSSQLIS
jgi:hypothetical protein